MIKWNEFYIFLLFCMEILHNQIEQLDYFRSYDFASHLIQHVNSIVLIYEMFTVCHAEFQTHGMVSLLEAKIKLQRVLSQITTANALREFLHRVVSLIMTHDRENITRYNWIYHVFRQGEYVKEEILFQPQITALVSSSVTANVEEVDEFLKEIVEGDEEEEETTNSAPADDDIEPSVETMMEESNKDICVLCHEGKPLKLTMVCRQCNQRTFTIQAKDKSRTIHNVMYCGTHKKYRQKHLPFQNEKNDPHFRVKDYIPIRLTEIASKKKKPITPTPRPTTSVNKCVKCQGRIRKKNPYQCCNRQACNTYMISYRGVQCQGSYCYTKHMMVVSLPTAVPFLSDVTDFCKVHPKRCIHIPLQMLDSVKL